jgi:hypothetical protein
MKVIRPTFVTDTILTSSTIPENDYPAWAAGSYALGAHVIRGHHRWESLVASNTSDPLTGDATKWLDMGATNRWSMFDQAKGSLATAVGSIEVVLAPGRIDCAALLDVVAKEVTATVTVSGTQVYSRTLVSAIGGHNIDNWYDWFFAPIGERTNFLFDDLPSYRNGVVKFTFTGKASDAAVSCGTLLMGRMFEIGITLSGVDIGIDDYSKKTRDQYGVQTIRPGNFSDTNSYQIAIQSSQVDAIKAVLASLRATPTVYIGEDGLDALFTYGTYKSFRINLQLLTGISNCSLETDGLV